MLTLSHFVALEALAFIVLRSTLHDAFLATVLACGAGEILHIAYACYIYPYYLSPMRHIPTPPGSSLLMGHFLTMVRNEMVLPLRTWHRQHGPIVRYMWPLGLERLSIADDEALKEMTIRNPYGFPRLERGNKWMAPFLGARSLLLVNGEEHARQRKLLSPAFSSSAIRDLQPVFWDKALEMTELWIEKARGYASAGEPGRPGGSSMPIEALDWLNRATLDIIGVAAFGREVGSLTDPDNKLRVAYRNIFSFDLVSNVLMLLLLMNQNFKRLPFKVLRTWKQTQDTIRAFARGIVEEKHENQERMGKANADKDIMSLIIRDNEKRKAGGVEEHMADEIFQDQVMSIIGAGHDTTATAVAWALHLLARNPEVQRRLRREIRSSMPGLRSPGGISESRAQLRRDPAQLAALLGEVDALPYLNNVAREALRFIPSITHTVRTNVQDARLGGHDIPAGQIMTLAATAINHLPAYWGDDVDVFDPDRWDRLPESWVPNAYMTFLAGPRGCIGRKFAETEVKVLLCCLLSAFEFYPDPRFGNPETRRIWRLVLRPRDGMNLKIRLLDPSGD